jgi:hypothetical protein
MLQIVQINRLLVTMVNVWLHHQLYDRVGLVTLVLSPVVIQVTTA